MASKTLLLGVFILAFAGEFSVRAQLLGLGLVHINGTVHCSIGTPTATTPVFANAGVELRCGSGVVSRTTTNSNGVFDMTLGLVPSLLSTLLNDCKAAVSAPLSSCDATLPTGGILQSPLELLSSAGGLLGLLNVVTSGFFLVN
ncbi:hypothetical protein HPP92_006917 [Vanilla planifolia]|uniref:Phylloplanin n=1 Tax=Vanilla planifolia TaxID=51239 RepID=A0A835R971_VANPL|nr:hypothetical protein HPP92_006917 [Vanilla planifolia]